MSKINKYNTSGFPGVSYSGFHQKWNGFIKVNGKKIHLGYYKNALEAALARFTFEVWCSRWKCDYNSELVKAIKVEWPEFRFRRRRTK
jgi:hypothetical protein